MKSTQAFFPQANIMIVDDTLDNLRLLSKVLSEQGYKVRGVPNGDRALKAAHLDPPDLILLDIRMPDMDGYEVCRQFKSDTQLRDTVVLFLSAMGETVDKVKGFEIGGVDYITKPFQEQEVLARVATHVALKKMQQRLEAQNTRLQTEIAERQHAEEGFRESETRAKALLHAIPDLMFRLNREGIFLDYKAAKTDLYIQADDLIIGKSCHELLPAELAELTHEYIRTTLDSGNMQMFEYQLPIPGRGLQTYEARMVTSGSHEVTVIIRDISERKQMEDGMRHAKDVAEAANRAKSVFLANMSHELRTPLHGILGFARRLGHNATLTEAQHEDAEAIRRNGELLLTVINDILDFTNIETNRLVLHSEEFALPDLLMQLADTTRRQARHKNISFTYEIPVDLPHIVYGDQKHLRQILSNLLENAVRFTKQGEIALQIIVGRKRGQSHMCHLKFEIHDTGVGIAAEQLEGIFQPFQQANPYRLQEGSTGLGLAISQRLVKMMASQLQVTSTEGKGSIFWFDLELPVIEMYGANIPQSRQDGNLGPPSQETLTNALTALPAEWLTRLKQGAEEIDVDILLAVIAQIRERDAALADALARLVDDFEYDEILKLISI